MFFLWFKGDRGILGGTGPQGPAGPTVRNARYTLISRFVTTEILFISIYQISG